MSRRTSTMPPSESNSVPPSSDGVKSKQEIMLYEAQGHFSMLRALHLADYVTEMNGFCGVSAVFSTMRYCLGDPTNYRPIWYAIGLMQLGLWFDFLDGKIARWRKKSSLMGQELDSLADLISFGLSPAVVAFALGLRTGVDHIILTFYVLCGLTRLARFNVTVANLPKDKNGKSEYFEGTPIPTSLYVDYFMGFWVYNGWTHENLPLGLLFEGTLLEFHPIALMFVLHGCLMVSKTLRIRKL